MVGGAYGPASPAVINGQTDFTMVTDPGKIQGEKAGMKLIIDMAKLKIPFQFTCTVTSGKIDPRASADCRDDGQGDWRSGALLQDQQERSDSDHGEIYPRAKPDVLEGSWELTKSFFEEDTYPTLRGPERHSRGTSDLGSEGRQ